MAKAKKKVKEEVIEKKNCFLIAFDRGASIGKYDGMEVIKADTFEIESEGHIAMFYDYGAEKDYEKILIASFKGWQEIRLIDEEAYEEYAEILDTIEREDAKESIQSVYDAPVKTQPSSLKLPKNWGKVEG